MSVEVFDLEVATLTAHPDNPRTKLDGIDELARSIVQIGILEPLLVCPVDGHFRVVAGHRRLAAAVKIGLTTVPCIVREKWGDDLESQRLAMIAENIQRGDLSTADKTRAFQTLAETGLTQRQIGDLTGVNQSTISRALKPPERKERAEKVTFTTYKRTDGEMIGGEFSFVTGLEWFDDDDEPTELLRETWVLKSTAVIMVGPAPVTEEPEVIITRKTKHFHVNCTVCGLVSRNTTREYAQGRMDEHLREHDVDEVVAEAAE